MATIVEPKYYKEFRCLGEHCPDHCCHSWNVLIDKASMTSLQGHKDIEIRQLSQTHIQRHSEDVNAWGIISMPTGGSCPMQDGKGLCEIHKRAGADSLSPTCRLYPRLSRYFGDRIENSLSMACIGAAQSILFDPESMQISASSEIPEMVLNTGLGSSDLTDATANLRDFCFDAALTTQLSFTQRLFIIGMVLRQAEHFLDDADRMGQILDVTRQMVADGELLAQFDTLPEINNAKWHLFAHQDNNLIEQVLVRYQQQNGLPRDEKRFLQFQQPLLRQLAQKPEDSSDEVLTCDPGQDHKAYTTLMAQAESEFLAPFFAEHPQLETNYLLYSLYHNQFMLKEGKSPFQFFRILVVDWLMLKSYLAGLALEQQGLNQETVAGLFAAYYRKRQHCKPFVPLLEEAISRAEMTSPAFVFGLLR